MHQNAFAFGLERPGFAVKLPDPLTGLWEWGDGIRKADGEGRGMGRRSSFIAKCCVCYWTAEEERSRADAAREAKPITNEIGQRQVRYNLNTARRPIARTNENAGVENAACVFHPCYLVLRFHSHVFHSRDSNPPPVLHIAWSRIRRGVPRTFAFSEISTFHNFQYTDRRRLLELAVGRDFPTLSFPSSCIKEYRERKESEWRGWSVFRNLAPAPQFWR